MMSDTARYLDVDALCAESDRDEVFTLLSNNRRRSVLYVLYRHDVELELSEVVSEVASCETGRPKTELDDEVTQSMYISLYQTHVPQLTSHGLVEYDDEDRTISLTTRARNAIVTSDRLEPPRWNRYYAVLLVAGLLGLVLARLTSGVIGWQLVSAFVLSGLGGVVAAHTRSLRQCGSAGSYLSLSDLA